MRSFVLAAMCVSVMSSVTSAGVISASNTAPTDVFASAVPDAVNFTRDFATGARTTDYNEGRGNEILSDTGDNNDMVGYTMTSLVVRKDADQDFTGTTASLMLYVFEGTKEMWDAGNGQSAGDSDPLDGTGITASYIETFALNTSYAEGEYISLNLDTPITMAADMGFFIKMTQGDSANTYFQIAQQNNPGAAVVAEEGYQYQAPSSGNFYTGSPLEYYAVGTVPEPTSLGAMLGLGCLSVLRRRR